MEASKCKSECLFHPLCIILGFLGLKKANADAFRKEDLTEKFESIGKFLRGKNKLKF